MTNAKFALQSNTVTLSSLTPDPTSADSSRQHLYFILFSKYAPLQRKGLYTAKSLLRGPAIRWTRFIDYVATLRSSRGKTSVLNSCYNKVLFGVAEQ